MLIDAKHFHANNNVGTCIEITTGQKDDKSLFDCLALSEAIVTL